MIEVTPLSIAQRFIGLEEVPGSVNNPQVMAFLRLDNNWPESDEVPWCSGFVNWVCWLLRLPRSKSLRARSWLNVGTAIELAAARPGFDLVILKRGGGHQPGPEVLDAPGHVGFFAGTEGASVVVLGGNQSDQVSLARYPADRLLGVRRLTEIR